MFGSKRSAWEFVPQSMVSWFSPGTLWRAALRAVLTETIGRYADRRDFQGAIETADHDYSERDELWLDYVADCGDGFEPTFAIARAIANERLTIHGQDTRPGSILLFGGDQVYPDAHHRGYEQRLFGPYDAAFRHRTRESAPVAFAIPGNHDWYDGLEKFLEFFCRSDPTSAFRTIRTPQRRSYWVIKLPGNWLCVGLDWHVGGTLDLTQREYLHSRLRAIQTPSRIMLLVANPAWVQYFYGKHAAYHELEGFIDAVERDGAHTVPLVITGDLHCYARYELRRGKGEGARQLIMAGGGGASLSSTHGLPLVDTRGVDGSRGLAFTSPEDPDAPNHGSVELRACAVHPPPEVTNAIAWGVLKLPLTNTALALLLMGPLYLLFNYVFRATGGATGPTVGWSVWQDARLTWASALESLATIWSAPYALSKLATGTLLLISLAAWSQAAAAPADGARRNRFRGPFAFTGGMIHGAVHIALSLLSVWFLAAGRHGADALEPAILRTLDIAFIVGLFEAARRYRLPTPAFVAAALFQGLLLLGTLFLDGQLLTPLLFEQVIVLSGLVGTLWLGLYLRLANLFGGHAGDVLACQAVPHFKNFLRMRVDSRGTLEVFPAAIDRVPTTSEWTLRDDRYDCGPGVQSLVKGIDRVVRIDATTHKRGSGNGNAGEE